MKKILYIILIITANVILFFAGILIYHEPVFFIKKLTIYSTTVDFFVFAVVLIATALFTLNHNSPGYKLRYIAIGLCSFIPAVFIFLFFYLNREFAKQGEYRTFEVNGVESWNNKFYLNIGFNMWANSIEVSPDKYLKVDSVQVRVNTGIFGMTVFSNDVKIVEVLKCSDFQPEENLSDSLYNYQAAKFYASKRCFESAIREYSNVIDFYPGNHFNYYNRGRIYFIRNDYKKALDDFKTAYILKYNSLNEDDLEAIRSFDRLESETKLKKSFDELSENPNQETFAEAFEVMQKYPEIEDLEMYSERIKFCIEKLKTTEI